MSWRAAETVARAQAAAARAKAKDTNVSEARMLAFRDYLRAWNDMPALEHSMHLRRAQHLDEFADHCRARAAEEDRTTVERRRGPSRSE